MKLRQLAFMLHRYIGIGVGLIIVISGLTGSLLVFQKEIDDFLITQKFGQIIPQEERVSIESVLNTVKAAYSYRPDLKLHSINMYPKPDVPYKVRLQSTNAQLTEVFVNPYTGIILGTRQWEYSFIGFLLVLHYTLLGGRMGEIVVGIAALLLLILNITGFILWPGWRKLIVGFKIKFKAHPQRVNFDIHKVVGIICAVFLSLVAFTGFCWNFSDFTYPAIYAASFTPQPVVPSSKFVPGKSPIGLSKILQTADTTLPGAVTTSIFPPRKPDGVFRIRKKFPEELEDYGQSFVYLDQYSGKVLQVQNGRSLPLGDKVLNSFVPLHYGTFGGLATRIFYVFIGLAPVILLLTGLVMWWYRRWAKVRHQQTIW
ncbi:peptidase [Nostocales cyanobacterium HT-58-2]|nr:peptidase [Nostocales cyanobacterium HT-58-2]